MSSQKGRDLAQELIDFLLKEDQQKGAASPSGDENKPKLSKVAAATQGDSDEAPPVPPPVPPVPDVPPPIPMIKPSAKTSKDQVEKKRPYKVPPLPQEKIKPVPGKVEAVEFPPESGTRADTKAITKAVTRAADPLAEVIEFTALSKVVENPDIPEPVNFLAPSEKANEILQRGGAGKPDATVKTEDFHFQPTSMQGGLVTQRSKVVFNEVSNMMAGAEAIKVAQARISVLEKERDKLREETEQLLSTSEALQRRLQELKTQNENLERRHREKIEILEDEKTVVSGRLAAREKELETFKKENEELKSRFQSDLRKIRVRERELEARQEIMKAEHGSVMKVKDETIMDLKRQTEKLQFELDNFRSQTSQLNARINEFHEKNLRTVKALRLALSVLETGEIDDKKKVGS